MNPDEYEFDSYEEEFYHDKFNIDPYEGNLNENDYYSVQQDFLYNPLDF